MVAYWEHLSFTCMTGAEEVQGGGPVGVIHPSLTDHADLLCFLRESELPTPGITN